MKCTSNEIRILYRVEWKISNLVDINLYSDVICSSMRKISYKVIKTSELRDPIYQINKQMLQANVTSCKQCCTNVPSAVL